MRLFWAVLSYTAHTVLRIQTGFLCDLPSTSVQQEELVLVDRQRYNVTIYACKKASFIIILSWRSDPH